MANRGFPSYIILILISLICITCKKTDSGSGRGLVTFIKEYDIGANSFNTNFIEQMPDGGFLILGLNGDNTKSLFLRLSKFGNLEWKREFNDDSFVTYYVHPNGNGTYLVNDYDHYRLSEIDTLGHIIKHNQFGPAGIDYENNQRLENGPGGTYLISISDGGTGANTQSSVLHFDPNLNYVTYDIFNDSNYFSGKTISFDAYEENGSGWYNVFGQKFLKQNWSWGDPRKLYFAKVAQGKKTAITIIDSANNSTDDNPYWQLINPDSSIVVVCQRLNYAINKNSPFIVKVDKNLKVVWQTDIEETNKNILTWSIAPSNDDGYLITGSVTNSSNSSLPYELKLDANGNKLWSKTIAIPGNSFFDWGIPCSDGGSIFVGGSTGFGNGKGNQVIFVKTDANGNL